LPPEVASRLALLNTNCSRGGSGSCIEIGRLSERGEGGIPRDPNRAAEAYGVACRQLDAEGCQRLEAMLGADDTMPSDLGAVLASFSSACGKRQADACVGLATLSAYGLGVPESAPRVAELLDGACRAGNGTACDRLGQLNRLGVGMKADLKEAARLEQRACVLGLQAACVRIGARVLATTDGQRGRSLTSVSGTDRALETFRTACSKGEYSGCVEHARALVEGTGVPKDVEAGKDLLTSSCADGYGPACQALGDLARAGEGERPGATSAISWWKKGCQLRTADACAQVGDALLHLNRPGADRRPRGDAESGQAYLERACQLHSPDGCRLLGQFLLSGHPSPADARRADACAEKACRYGAAEGCSPPRPGRALRGY
jgi:TPR repeat protein